RRARDVADREDVRHVGPQLLVDIDEAAIRHLNAGRVRSDELAVRRAADGYQHAAIHLWSRCFLTFESHAQSLGQRLDLRHSRAQQDLLVAGADAPLERTHQIRVAARHELRCQLDDTHAAANGIVDASHLEPDDAAADDEQPARELGQLQRIGRVHDARILGQARQPYRLGASRDDALLEANALRAAVAHHLEHVRAHEAPRPLDHFDLALLRERAQAPGQPLDDRALPAAQLIEVDLRRTEGAAAGAHLLGVLDD